jgi:hypothetical protein
LIIKCLILAPVKGWNLLKVDEDSAFLVTKINENEEVFMFLDQSMTIMVTEWISVLRSYVQENGRTKVRVDKAI